MIKYGLTTMRGASMAGGMAVEMRKEEAAPFANP